MQLKTLEIKGFKSFADKVVIHFNEDMTGIVGPNGCGKSNTVDAIRWVLGEQKSKALRLEKMENIIFNGTKSRKASGKAEVSLTFENTRNLLPTEFQIVTVSRILYRTGDSEYRLNNVRCRLKDISNLFMDTGISSDSYAIIELSMIDDILKDKENSRRRLFEQAAGVSKYKVRKRQTFGKLKATDADLSRVEDLLFEIESNLKTLEKQAKRTARLYKIKDQYKELSVEFALYQLEGFKGSFDELNAKLEQESDRKIELETGVAQLEASLAKNKVEVIVHEKALAKQQKELNEHIAFLRDQENKKNLLSENSKYLGEKRTSLVQNINTAESLIAALEEEVAALTEQKDTEEGILKTLSEQLTELKERVDEIKKRHILLKQQLDTIRRVYRDVERKLFEMEKTIAVKTSQKDNLIHEIRSNKLRFQSRNAEIEELTENLQKKEAEWGRAKSQLSYILIEAENLKNAQTVSEADIEKVRQELIKTNRALDARRNEYNLTKSLVDSLEGFPDSVKFLKKNKQWKKETPLLLDLLNCEASYRVAIENYLKPYLNTYIVETLADAMTGTSLLEKANKGKANFFILNGLKNTNIAPSEAIEGAVRALDIIETEAIYLPLMQHLLHGVYIVDDKTEIKKEWLSYGNVFVKQSGKLVQKKEQLRGGSVGSYEGKRIGQRQHLVVLQQEIEDLKAKANELTKSISEQQQQLSRHKASIKTKENWINHQHKELNDLNNRIIAFKLKIENSQAAIKESETRKSGLENQVQQLKEAIQVLNEQLKIKSKDKKEQLAQIKKVEQSFYEVDVDLRRANQSYNEQNIEFHKQQNRINSITQNLGFKSNQLKNTKQQISTNTKALIETENKLNEIENKLDTSDTGLKSLYDKKEALEKALQEAEVAYYDIRGTVDEIEQNLRTFSKNKEQSDVLLNSIKEKITQLKMQLLSLKERLRIEFKVDIDEIIDQAPTGKWDKVELADKVARLKQRIESYGEINPLAIEAFNEMKERYDFIVAQRQDLVTAKQSLLETIEEIEKTATDHFMEAFYKVRDNFQEVFRSLFNEGDQCDLHLLHENDPLESPIEIMAKPKGKRPQSINQLSGGEKSLTALALVFALYLLKPAPFCILDEVDAPLDDTNVSKFTKIIRQFSEKSQFIIVTHNKNTMAEVDVIYGVTMQESGVSKVIPVDFRTLEAS